MYSLEEKVRNFSIFSRIFVIVIQIVSNFAIHDHEAGVFISPADPSLKTKTADKIIEFTLYGLKRWDAQYFIHIAEYGYTHENTLAFFPLYPLLVRWVGTIFNVVFGDTINFHNCLLLASILINLLCFVKASVILFKLSQKILKSDYLAYRAALLFCFNPASIFFVSPYSESLYAFLTFSALLYLENNKTNLSALVFLLAAFTRSNGIVNLGFLIYTKMQDSVSYFYRIQLAKTETGSLHLIVVVILSINYLLIPVLTHCILVCLPFLLFQIWCYQTYCKEDGVTISIPPHLELYLRSNFFHSPDLGEAEWCLNSPPFAYPYVQEKYWETGLFRYYVLKQLPNFLLALPVVLTVISHAALYMVDNPKVFWRLGIIPRNIKRDECDSSWTKSGLNSPKLFVFVVHSLALCVFCVICIHVQVTTRLICSSSPVIYWFAAYLISDLKEEKIITEKRPRNKKQRRKNDTEESVESKENLTSRFKVSILSPFPSSFWGQAIISYFIIYFCLGIVLFSNFLPWT